MPVIDVSAYPHIVEAILSEPVAWRAARCLNRYWRDTIDEAMDVVTVSEIDHFLSTTLTARLPKLRLDLQSDKTPASRHGRLPPIRRLNVCALLPGECRTVLFNMLGKVHTTYVWQDSFHWTHPCQTFIAYLPLQLHVPRGVRKLVILDDCFNAAHRVHYDALHDTLPLSVSQVTVSFHYHRFLFHQSTPNINKNIFMPLAEVLVRGCVLNIVDLLVPGQAHKEHPFTTEVRTQVAIKLLNPPFPAPLVTEPIDEVMGRLRFYDFDIYRQLNPGEL